GTCDRQEFYAMSAKSNSPSSRRDFVKASMLACAAGPLLGRVSMTAAETTATGSSAGSNAAGRTFPTCPYGTGEPIYLADFEKCQPASSLAWQWKPNCWKLIGFKADKINGTMLTAGQNTAAADVEYAIGREGWYAIHFGLMSKY